MLTLNIDTANSPYGDRQKNNYPATALMSSSSLPKPKPLADIQSESQESSRGPSPQPTHFSVPSLSHSSNGHRTLRSATVGYVAPEFTGKVEQVKVGKFTIVHSAQYCPGHVD